MSLHEVATELFKRFDQENKGFITLDQLRNCHLSGDQSEFSDGEILSIFSAIDKDQKGSISLEEFTSAFLFISGANIEYFDDSFANDYDNVTRSSFNSEDGDLYEANGDYSDVYGDSDDFVYLETRDGLDCTPTNTSCLSKSGCTTRHEGSSPSPDKLLRRFSKTLWARFHKSDTHVLPTNTHAKASLRLASFRKWKSFEAEMPTTEATQPSSISSLENLHDEENQNGCQHLERTGHTLDYLDEPPRLIISRDSVSTSDLVEPCSTEQDGGSDLNIAAADAEISLRLNGMANGGLSPFSKSKSNSKSSVTREFDEIFGQVDSSRSPSSVSLDSQGPEQLYINVSEVGGKVAKALGGTAFRCRSSCECSCHVARTRSGSLSRISGFSSSKARFSRSSSSLHCASFSASKASISRLSKAHSSIDLTSNTLYKDNMEEVPEGTASAESDGEDLGGASQEDWQWYLKKIGGNGLFASNQTLRYMWGQIVQFHHELAHPLEDFLKSLIGEFQAAYSACLELENALHSKQELHEKELAALCEEVENNLTKEKDALNDKHAEREEYLRSEMALLSEAKERALQEQAREAQFLEDQLQHLVEEVNTLRTSSENTDKAFQELSKTERLLRHEIFVLTQENLQAEQALQTYEKNVRDLQDYISQMNNKYEVEKANHARIVRRYQDLVEEKEFLDQNVNTLSTELDELRSKRSPRKLDKCAVVSEEMEEDERPGKKRKPESHLSLSPRASLSPCDLRTSPPPLWLDLDLLQKRAASPEADAVPNVFSSPLSTSSPARSPPVSPVLPIGLSPVSTLISEESFAGIVSSKVAEEQGSGLSDEPFLRSSTPMRSACIRLASVTQKDFKVIFCGDFSVGKSSVIRRMCGEPYLKNGQSTIHPDCYSKILSHKGTMLKMRVWDTVGQERFGSIPTSYYRRSDVVILVYDITRRRSLAGLSAWLEDVREYCESTTLFVIIGNKVDINHKRKIKYADGQAMARENDAIFLETSARTGENVDLMCEMIASTLVEQNDYVFVRGALDQTMLTYGKNRRKQCCQSS